MPKSASPNKLDCLADPDRSIEPKGFFPKLSHGPPDPGNESPGPTLAGIGTGTNFDSAGTADTIGIASHRQQFLVVRRFGLRPAHAGAVARLAFGGAA
jgi:hypothetical protein